jgi:predicted HTH transcriptional regulator
MRGCFCPNPLIAGAFHRTGAVEVWGRGTNRVIAACKRHGTEPPKFKERQSFLGVTFKVEMVAGTATPQVTQHVSPQVEAILEAARQASSAGALQRVAGLKDRVHFLKSYLQPLLEQGLLERTISVAETIVVEIKAVQAIEPIHEAQLLTYLKLGGWKLGLLINFNVPVLKDGIRRRIL